MFCSQCGSQIKTGSLFCSDCGARIAEGSGQGAYRSASSDKNPVSFMRSRTLGVFAFLVVLGLALLVMFRGNFGSRASKRELHRSLALNLLNKTCYAEQHLWYRVADKLDGGQSVFVFDKKFDPKELLPVLSKSGCIAGFVSLYNPEPKVEQVGQISQRGRLKRQKTYSLVDVELRNVSKKLVRVALSVKAINRYQYMRDKPIVSRVEKKAKIQLAPNETKRITLDLWTNSCCRYSTQSLSNIEVNYQASSLYPPGTYQLQLRRCPIVSLRAATVGSAVRRETLFAIAGRFLAKEITGITQAINNTAAQRVEYTLTIQPGGLGSRGKEDFDIRIVGRNKPKTFSVGRTVRAATFLLYDNGWRVAECDRPNKKLWG